MRKIFITLLVLVAIAAAIGAAWIFEGSRLSLLVDQVITTAPPPEPIKSIIYEGNGAGGVLRCNGLALSLNDSTLKQPNVGTTKENELALSFGGKVFPFGPVKSGDLMGCDVPASDMATVLTWHGVLSWPTAFDFNFMTGKSASWKRHTYRKLTWTKANGTKLEIVWRYEQHFLPGNGWTDALMIADNAPGLIRVDISGGAR